MPETNREEIAKLETLYASNPDGRVFTHLAEAYRKAGEYDRARSILEQGLTKHPAYASAHVVLGRVFMDLNSPEEAFESFRRVLNLDPHNLVALRSLGDLSRAAGRHAEAIGYYEELRHQDPSNEELEGVIAELLAAPAPGLPAGEPDAAGEQDFGEGVADFGEVGPGDSDLEWAGERDTEDALPGDLAGFAGLSANANDGQEGYGDVDLDVASLFEEESGVAEPEDVLPLDLSELAEPATEALEEPAFFSEASFPTDQPLPGAEPLHEEVAEEPYTEGSFAEEPVQAAGTDEPFSEEQFLESSTPQPFTEEPVTEEPVAEELVTEQPFAEQPVAEEPVTEEPFAGEPLAEEPFAEPAFTDEPFAGESISAAPVLSDETADLDSWAAEPAAPKGEVVTETMAELYRNQGLYDRAAEVYRSLLEQRPGEDLLRAKLAEVEALDSGGMPPALQATPLFEEPAAKSENYPEPNQEPAQEADELSSVWTDTGAAAANVPTPYAWAEDTQPAQDEGPPVSAYFQALLAWRPAVSATAEAPEVEAVEPEILDLGTPLQTAEEPLFEEPAVSEEPEEWEPDFVPAEAATPEPPVAQPVSAPASRPASPSDSPVDDAFDEWFGTPEPASESPPEGAQAAAASEERGAEGEDDDDLEMFRSWLQSLKK